MYRVNLELLIISSTLYEYSSHKNRNVTDIYSCLVADYNRIPDDWPPVTQIYCLWDCTSLTLAVFLVVNAYTDTLSSWRLFVLHLCFDM